MSGRGVTTKRAVRVVALAIKAARVSDNQPIVENPIIVKQQVENHLYRNRKQTINLLIETKV